MKKPMRIKVNLSIGNCFDVVQDHCKRFKKKNKLKCSILYVPKKNNRRILNALHISNDIRNGPSVV